MLRRWSPCVFTGAAVAVLLIASSGCTRKQAVPAPVPPDLTSATTQTKCSVRRSADKPLVVEWPAADRAFLEAQAQGGLVAVRYEGCEMQLLSGCQVGGTYEYMALGRKQERVTIHNEDELYARLPVGAASLEGKLKRFGALHVDMTIVGRKQATRHVFERSELNGRCDDATHVLTGLTLGAFSLVTGASLDADASASFAGAAAGGGMTRRSELLASDGDPTQCDATTMLGTQIPDCSAVLRVEAIPLATPQPITAPPPVAAPAPRSRDKSEALARKKRAARKKQEHRRQKAEKEKAMDPVERERQRQRRFAAAWRGVGIGASMLTGGSLGLMAAGAALLTQYSNDARDPDFVESASDRTRRETGTRRLSLGIAGTLGFGALAATAFGMSWRLRHDIPPITASVSPQFTGLSISGRF